MSVVIDGTSGITLPDGNEIDGGFTAKAWVNFQGTSTVAIRADGNVSSITDNGSGDYTINFSSALTDSNYSTPTCGGGTADNIVGGFPKPGTTKTSSAIRIIIRRVGSIQDIDTINLSAFR